MKTKMLWGWRWMLVVGSTMMLLGCLDETSGNADTNVDTAVTSPVPNDDFKADTLTNNPPIRVAIPPANLSPKIAELVQLAQSGVSEEVLLAYVQKSAQSFNPTVDEIVYLKDIGVPDSIVAETVRKGDLPAELAKTAPATEPTNVIEAAAEKNSNATSLTDATAPSYSVAADPAYSNAEVPQQVNINYFESTLSPYGNWVDVADYGRCWQPTVVIINRNWRPYCDRGRWIYTSSGWYWQSDYSWGWAPFHYGRWHCDNRIGWVWVPDSTWGPAWVSWRYTDQYCGWAPLPPRTYFDGFGFRFHNRRVGISFDFGLPDRCFSFIPVTRFCDRTPLRFIVSGSHSSTIFRNSTVINNYIRVNNTIVNEGVGRDRIVRATQTPIRTVTLRDLPGSTTPPIGRTERLEGNSLTVFRPNMSVRASAPSRSHSQSSGATSVSATAPVPTSTTRNLSVQSISPTHSTTSAQSSVQSVSPIRNTRSITRTETAPTTSPAQTPIVTTAPVRQTPSTTRSSSPTTRNLPTRVQQEPAPTITTTSPNAEPTSPGSAPSIVIRPNTGSSAIRNLPSQNHTPQPHRNIGGHEENITSTETPHITRSTPTIVRTPSPVQTQPTRETRIVEPAPVRSQPAIQIPQPQPQPSRETRRQEFFDQRNSGGADRSLRSIAPAPIAPPVQQFIPPQRETHQVERSVPHRSEPAPSRSVSAPRENAPTPRAQETPSSRERGNVRRN
jgi:hypothetical protein